ncbi:MAG TPA: SAM-dependent methyltransferase, partial [Candidatus Polarisedimenticolia bacterium]|nr:SAM-dependent methyltransferase [Candidatus Polarisedimenticolia bacterium]
AETVGPFWPPQRRHTETGYRALAFPFPERRFPSIAMQQSWTLEELGAYLRTWSSVVRFVTAWGFDPVVPLLEDVSRIWGPAQRRRKVEWPLAGRLGWLPATQEAGPPKPRES